MKKKIFFIVATAMVIVGCSEKNEALSEQEQRREYAIKTIFMDVLVDIPMLQQDRPIKEVTIQCLALDQIVNRSTARYAQNGMLLGAENASMVDGVEKLSTVDRDDRGRWQKRQFNNLTATATQVYKTDERGYIIGIEGGTDQRYEYNDNDRLSRTMELHAQDGVVLTEYEYNSQGLLSKLNRRIFPDINSDSVAEISVGYVYHDNGKIELTKNSSKFFELDLQVEWDEIYQNNDEYGNWLHLPLGDMTNTIISTGEQGIEPGGSASCTREIVYY